jgi:2-polyprenyl-3-methyl-5-hydroxy-6-metoxy-1,4-benzoquinol methylase
MNLTLDQETIEYVKSISGPGYELITKVHPADEMYLFFTTHPDHLNTPLKSYFVSGNGMVQDFLEILSKSGKSIGRINSFLEFACGYGRFTRHLLGHLDPKKITVSDVYKGAVDFQKATFGVEGFYSEFDPAELEIQKNYDVIFVASLFSHLPEKTWRPWLKKLFNSLSDNGVLIFSTHGTSCMADPAQMPHTGFLYLNMSESKSHSFDDYGTTYVTSDFVQTAVRENTGASVLLEIPKGLWSYQDVYVVKRVIQ